MLSSTSGVNVVYSPNMIPQRTVDKSYNGEVGTVITSLLDDTGLSYKVIDNQYILYRSSDDQSPFVISGYVEDAESGERLIGAHVYDLMTGEGSVTNEYGFFSLHTQGSNALVRASYLGFRYDTLLVSRQEAAETQNIRLDKLVLLHEVVIEGEQSHYQEMMPLTRHHFTDQQLTSKASPGGESDIQRYIETEPGVSIGIDGVGGLHIRGGSGDQNLILLDGVPIYVATHAIGMLSVVNPLMVRDVTLIKGAFPARYGGRLSSILDVRTKEGSDRQWSVQSSIGPVAADVLVEGPVIKDKVGILVAGRHFVPGFYLRELSRRQKVRQDLGGETQYAFNDLNAKCNITLTQHDHVFLSYYYGDDKYDDITRRYTADNQTNQNEQFTRNLNWGNAVGALRWNHQFGLHLFANATLILSSFDLKTVDSILYYSQPQPSLPVSAAGFNSSEFSSRIDDKGVRLDFDHFLSNTHRLRYGASLTRHVLTPKRYDYSNAAQVDSVIFDPGRQQFPSLDILGLEGDAYVEDEIQIGKEWTISSGLHLSAFQVRQKTYWSLQPRLAVDWKMSEAITAHASAGAMTQYLHLLTSSGIGLPTDLWVPSTPNIKPQQSVEATVGLSWKLSQRWNLQWDAYERKMHNLIEYKEGASFLIPEGSVQFDILDAANWENKVTQGSGNARGIEFSTSYTSQKAECEVSYTYSKSTRQFADLNFGKSFPFRFDRRHAVAITGVYHINKRLMLTGGWNFATGIPITLAYAKYPSPTDVSVFSNVEVLSYSDRNAYRLPAYHRLDLGAQYCWVNPKATHCLQLDLYNVYNRANVLYVTVVQDGNTFKSQQFTVLPFIPSLSYKLKI